MICRNWSSQKQVMTNLGASRSRVMRNAGYGEQLADLPSFLAALRPPPSAGPVAARARRPGSAVVLASGLRPGLAGPTGLPPGTLPVVRSLRDRFRVSERHGYMGRNREAVFTPQPRVAQRTLGYEAPDHPKPQVGFTSSGSSTATVLQKRVRERPGMLASPSPSSQWGRFPIFTGVRVSHRATPTEVAP